MSNEKFRLSMIANLASNGKGFDDPANFSEFAPFMLEDYGSVNVTADPLTFEKWCFQYKPFIDAINLDISENARKTFALELVKSWHAAVRWASFGMPLFDLTHSLCAKLILTDPEDVLMTEIPFPFPIFVLRLPLDFGFVVKDDNGTYIPIKNVWVHSLEFEEFGRVLSIECSPGNKTDATLDAVNRIEEKKISKWIDDDVIFRAKPSVESPRFRVEPDPKCKASISLIKRLLVNFCLYLSSTSCNLSRSGSWKRRADEKVLERGVPHSWVAGRDIKLGKEILSAAKANVASEFSGDGAKWKLKKSFVVRGHYRWQPCGPRNEDRKRIMIDPFWKGPVDSIALRRSYKSEEPKEERNESERP